MGPRFSFPTWAGRQGVTQGVHGFFLAKYGPPQTVAYNPPFIPQMIFWGISNPLTQAHTMQAFIPQRGLNGPTC